MDNNAYGASPFSVGHWTNNTLRDPLGAQNRHYNMLSGSDFSNVWGQSKDDYIFDIARNTAPTEYTDQDAFILGLMMGLNIYVNQNGGLSYVKTQHSQHVFSNGVVDYSSIYFQHFDLIGAPTGGFWTGAWEGVKGGAMSTWNFGKGLVTFDKDTWMGVGNALGDHAKKSLIYGGMAPAVDMAKTVLAGAQFAKEVPNMTAYDAGYAVGYGTEKLVEGAIVARLTGSLTSIAARGSSSTVLRHYTSEAGYNAIMKSKVLNPSIGIKNARYGSGQYFTDLMSEGLTAGQVSRRLFGVPWNSKKISHFIDVDMKGLNVIKNAKNNYLVPGTNSLPLGGRIVNHGVTIFD